MKNLAKYDRQPLTYFNFNVYDPVATCIHKVIAKMKVILSDISFGNIVAS